MGIFDVDVGTKIRNIEGSNGVNSMSRDSTTKVGSDMPLLDHLNLSCLRMSLFVDDDVYDGNETISYNEYHIKDHSESLEDEDKPVETATVPDHQAGAQFDSEWSLANNLPTVTSLLPLKFQKKLLEDIISNDTLAIVAPGLGLRIITAHLLHLADISGKDRDGNGSSMVFLLNASAQDNDLIADEMREIAAATSAEMARGLTVIQAEKSQHLRRVRMYNSGGIFSVSAQALLVDMLTPSGLDCSKISGLVVINAHKTSAACKFALKLFRDKNQHGFIKALSDEPERFTSEFNFETYLRQLKVSKVSLWPRFHLDVVDDLDPHRYKKRPKAGFGQHTEDNSMVIELSVPMTESMKIIQTILLDQMNRLSSQIRSDTRDMNVSDWANGDDNAIQRKYSSMISMALDPVWHKLPMSTRNFVVDLQGVEGLLDNLTTMDSVSYFQEIKQLRSYDNEPPTWLYRGEGETLYALAEQRAGKENPGNYLEEQPKYQELKRILDEIAAERVSSSETTGPTLIMCNEKRVVHDLQAYLRLVKTRGNVSSGQAFMKKRLKNVLEFRELMKGMSSLLSKSTSGPSGPISHSYGASTRSPATNFRPQNVRPNNFPSDRKSQRRRVRGGGAATGITRAMADSTSSEPAPAAAEESDEEVVETGWNQSNHSETMEPGNIIIIRQYQGALDENLLYEVRPSRVILYEPDPAFVRRLELYRAIYAPPKFKPFFLYYRESVEEARFLYQVRHEKDTFTALIDKKAKLPVILDTPSDHNSGISNLLRTINTRVAGGGLKSLTATADERSVIVDAREFKSATLPYTLYQKGILVIPAMLTVGDFVISPEICIERKSVADLVGSLNNGRLYQQCINMFRYYDLPMLLIEFKEVPSSSKYGAYQPLLDEQVRAKLDLLLLIFPKLKILWSFSPDHSTEIILSLKLLRQEPDLARALAMGTTTIGDSSEQQNENTDAIDTLLQLPGVNESNVFVLTSTYNSIREISHATEEELKKLIGKECSKRLFTFLNAKPSYF